MDHLVRLRPRPDVVFATGDLVDKGTREEYRRLRHLLAPLPNGRVAAVGSIVQNGAPHHGASRIIMRVVDFASQPRRPSAPSVTVRPFNGQLRVAWTAVPDAAGYRVEYRVGDGSWNELSRWFDAGDLVAPYPTVRTGVTYSFRVRAFNDGGASAYSEVASITPGRQRAVRK